MSGDAAKPIWVTAIMSLHGEAHRIWAYLHWRQGENASAWPSLPTIAQDLGLTVQGVRNITRRLASHGWLKIETPDGRGRSHGLRYSVTCPEGSIAVDLSEGEKVNGGLPIQTPEGSIAVDLSEAKRSTTVDQKGKRPFTRTHTRTQKKEKSLSSDAVRLAELLLDLIVARKSDFRRPNLTTWAEEIDRMIRLDHRAPQKIEDVIRWSQRDPFWQNNILGPSKLRQKFDQLELKMKGSSYDRQNSAPLRDDYDYGDDLVDVRTGERVPGVRS